MYDAENRLMRVTTNATGPQGALVVNYAYDANGRRTQKSVVKNGVTTATDYLSDGDHEVAEYSANASTPSKRFIYGQSVDEVIAQQDVATNTYSYAHRNHQGSVVAVSNASGQVTSNNIYTYSPYGEVNSVAGFPFRYTGRRLDPETGLYYYRARYYDSGLGRFLQTDPIGYKDQMNLYAYVGNDPVNLIDPSGKQACDNQNDCYEAKNFKEEKSDGKTVSQSENIDSAAVNELPKHESKGDVENGVRFDENESGEVTTTKVPTTTVVKGNIIKGTLSGVGGADAVGHSHPNDKSDTSPGPHDDAAVNAGFPNNIVHDGNIVVVEKINGQFRVRVLNDNNLTKAERRNMQRSVNKFQRRVQ